MQPSAALWRAVRDEALGRCVKQKPADLIKLEVDLHGVPYQQKNDKVKMIGVIQTAVLAQVPKDSHHLYRGAHFDPSHSQTFLLSFNANPQLLQELIKITSIKFGHLSLTCKIRIPDPEGTVAKFSVANLPDCLDDTVEDVAKVVLGPDFKDRLATNEEFPHGYEKNFNNQKNNVKFFVKRDLPLSTAYIVQQGSLKFFEADGQIRKIYLKADTTFSCSCGIKGHTQAGCPLKEIEKLEEKNLCARDLKELFEKQKKNKKVEKITKEAKKENPQIPGSRMILQKKKQENPMADTAKQNVEKSKQNSTDKNTEKGNTSKSSVEKTSKPTQDKSVEKNSKTIQDREKNSSDDESPNISSPLSIQGKKETHFQVTKVPELSSEEHFPSLSPQKKTSPRKNSQTSSPSSAISQPITKDGAKKASRASPRIALKSSPEIPERLDVIEEEEKNDFKKNLDTGDPESESSA